MSYYSHLPKVSPDRSAEFLALLGFHIARLTKEDDFYILRGLLDFRKMRFEKERRVDMMAIMFVLRIFTKYLPRKELAVVSQLPEESLADMRPEYDMNKIASGTAHSMLGNIAELVKDQLTPEQEKLLIPLRVKSNPTCSGPVRTIRFKPKSRREVK